MSALAAALDALFGDPHLARHALYRVGGAGEGVPVRVVARQPDQVIGLGEIRVHVATSVFDLRVSEVAEPKAGDTLTIDDETFVVQGEPTRDRERLLWTLDTRPA